MSTHATFGAAAAATIRAWNNGNDAIDILQSTNGTRIGPITRRYISIKQAVKDNGDSRVFGGIHFQFDSDVGSEIGDAIGKATLEAFEEHWDEFQKSLILFVWIKVANHV